MIKTFKKIFNLLSNKERKKIIFLFIIILIMAFLDMIGIASIMPFMAVLADPGIVNTNLIFKNIYTFTSNYGIENEKQFLFLLGTFVFMFLIFSLAFKAFATYLQLRFAFSCHYTLTARMVDRYLSKPYSWFLNSNSANLEKTILSESSTVINGALAPSINLLAQVTVTIVILTLLFIATPKLSLIVCLTLIIAYGIVYLGIRSKISNLAKQRFKSNELRFKTLSEAFGAIKEIKFSGLENIYTKRFIEPSKILAQSQVKVQVFSQLPRYALEATAFGGLLLAALYLLDQKGTFAKAIPIIGLYALAGYRLMPALQQIYASITQIGFSKPAIDYLHDEFKITESNEQNNNTDNKEVLNFNQAINLKNVEYSYPNSSRSALKNLTLSIPYRSTVGIVGSTGSGKTTTVDIILGLLESQKGQLEVDNKIINKYNRSSWQRYIGYVPQHIYLADDTVSANIAFGVSPEDITQESVEQASKIANLHDFVTNELPIKYQTEVGERGIRLSGGQRQRIGIARALYHNPKILILDEATSSLDNLTEQAVMDAVRNLQKKITIILIAHRLSTVKECDNIFLLDKGELKDKGTYQELINSSEIFKKMASKDSKIETKKY